MKINFKYLGLAASVFLGGCATLFSGTTQKLNVKAVDAATGAPLDLSYCTVVDGSGGSYMVASNPGTVVLSKSQGSLRIDCKKEGYKQLNTAVGEDFNKLTLVNVLFWPGFIIDGFSGAYKKYPSHYVVTMEKTGPSSS